MSEKSSDNQQFYRMCFGDIIAGFSIFEFRDRAFYLKHFSELDLSRFEYESKQIEKEGKSKNISPEKEKIKFLIETGNWSDEEEREYLSLEKEIKQLTSKTSKIFLKSQRKGLEKELSELKTKYNKIRSDRDDLVGMTLEKYTEKKRGEELLRTCLFKEKELINLVFSKDEYEEMDDEEYISFIRDHNFFMLRFSEDNLKKISVSPFFLNAFFLAKDSVFEFYGKRILDLTYFQQFLFSKGISHKNVLSQPDKIIPSEYYEDLDKLVAWFESSTGAVSQQGSKSRSANSHNNATALVGATKEELEAVAASQGARVVNMAEELRKFKKEIGKEEMDLHDSLEFHRRLGI